MDLLALLLIGGLGYLAWKNWDVVGPWFGIKKDEPKE